MNDTLWYIVINVPNNLLINHISFLNSQKYEINSNGASKVFKFKGSAIGVYEIVEV